MEVATFVRLYLVFAILEAESSSMRAVKLQKKYGQQK